jgi:hypothetical protein
LVISVDVCTNSILNRLIEVIIIRILFSSH